MNTRRATRIAASLATLAALLAACDREPDFQHERLLVFGTVVEVSLYGSPQDTGDALLEEIEDALARRHAQWHAWEESELTRFNAELQARGDAAVPDALAPLLETGLSLAERTGYRMDPGIGALIEDWGFHGEATEPDTAPPARSTIDAWRDDPHSAADLRYTDGRVEVARRDLQLDFGAVAKGIALAELRTVLEEARAEEAISAGIINAGGDLITVGRPGNRDWAIGVRSPGGQGVLGTLRVDGGDAVFTSGSYERGFQYDDTWYHHVLDPDTGEPAEGLESVTVIHDDPALADAAATALLVAGPEEWPQVAGDLGLRDVLAVAADNTITATAPMAERLELEDDSGAALEVIQAP
ncbi:FAD:protein FMN transferase [Aquisalimonas asiatica]|uniref:FAD:protein FMN transferase n=1 Tax=Aquisalimonas asiatica TaxID=406100 RepID=A0A1H8TPT6_9GAMM|nr:FAD:protein FMN transferase [Aquisalimonas asiatica]SEO92982.1 thiamine biosynthesis lipoprotein [Aquisalimonas asiatica]